LNHKKPIRCVSALLVILFCFTMTGCDDAYRAAAKGTDDVASATSAAIPAVAQLYKEGTITQAEKNAIAGILLNVVDVNTEFRNNVKALHAKPATTKADYVNAVNSYVQSVRNLLASGDLHVKNANGQQKLDLLFQAIQAGLTAVSTAVSSAKG